MNLNTTTYSRRSVLKAGAAAAAAGAITVSLRPGNVRAAPQADASPEFRALSGAVEDAMKAAGVPGVALAVFANGRQEVATFGVADLERGEAVTQTTRFQNGSITKPYTAMAAMRLVQDGLLDIDAPVKAYIPELHLADARTADHVTARHLLTHAGGWWGDGFIDNGDDDQALARYVSDLLPTFPQITPLGEYLSYNNSGISLLGRIIEVLTGQTYREAMQQLVLDPLGLSRTTFDPSVAFAGSYARGYGPSGDNPAALITPLLLPRNVDPAGGIWTDILDQIRFGRAQFADGSIRGPRVLDKAAFREMQSPLRSIGADGEGAIGWTWGVVDIDGHRLINHDGGTFGQSSSLIVLPDDGYAVAILTNSQSGGEVAGIAQREAFKQYFGVDRENVIGSPTPPAPPKLTPAELREYAGRYEVPLDRATLTVTDGTLHFKHEMTEWFGALQPSNGRSLPEGPLTFVAKDTVVLGPPDKPAMRLGFERRRDGTIGWLIVGSRMVPKLG